jgi:tetratricopeptide (TPR) repeat protein
MAEILLLATVLAGAALLIAWPLLGAPAPPPAEPDPEREALLVRHRLALEALRDVQADYRAGSLDEAAYATQRAEAEAVAADSLAALEVAPSSPLPPAQRRDLRLPLGLAAAVVALLLVGFALPSPLGLGERDERLERIRQLTEMVAEDPRNTAALGELADLYQAGGTRDELGRALASLVLLRDAAPADPEANRRLITLLIQLGLWQQAEAATDIYADVSAPDEADIPFFRGLIARGSGQPDEAMREFDQFLDLAPDDPRAPMVRSLRDEAAEGG